MRSPDDLDELLRAELPIEVEFAPSAKEARRAMTIAGDAAMLAHPSVAGWRQRAARIGVTDVDAFALAAVAATVERRADRWTPAEVEQYAHHHAGTRIGGDNASVTPPAGLHLEGREGDIIDAPRPVAPVAHERVHVTLESLPQYIDQQIGTHRALQARLSREVFGWLDVGCARFAQAAKQWHRDFSPSEILWAFALGGPHLRDMQRAMLRTWTRERCGPTELRWVVLGGDSRKGQPVTQSALYLYSHGERPAPDRAGKWALKLAESNPAWPGVPPATRQDLRRGGEPPDPPPTPPAPVVAVGSLLGLDAASLDLAA